ncbi:MAG: hypothetical protein QM725_12315 [Lacibacter sp.]
MKPSILFLFILLLFSACRKATEAPSLKSIIKQGSWYVNLMKDNGTAYTSSYSGWKFSFKTDSTLTVTNGVDSCSGTWREDVERDKFLLDIESSNLGLIWISQEWDIKLKTPSRVIFMDNKYNPSMELQLTKY